MNIRDFKKGEIITRVMPSKPYSTGGDEVPDYSFIGSKFVLLGILNGCIYVEKHNPSNIFMSLIFGASGPTKSVLKLPVTLWEEGWEMYVDPTEEFGLEEVIEFIEDLVDNNKNKKTSLEEKLEEAIKNDDFEKAEEIKKKIENLRNKNNK